MLPKGVKPYEFPIDKDMYLVVNKDNLIQALHKQYQIILAPEDIKILDDGLRLQISFGANNPLLSVSTFKKITDFFTTEGIAQVKYDDQVLKMWLFCETDFLFLDSGDSKLEMTPAGVDAPEGTIQVELGEGKVYTLLRCQPEKINEAVSVCLMLVGKKLITTKRSSGHKVLDNKVETLRQKYSIFTKYNAYISMATPKINKIIVHI